MNYNLIINKNKDFIDETFKKLDNKLSKTAIKSRNKIPYFTKNGVHDDYSKGKDITWWTNGFWGGLMWIMYNATKNEEYRITAEKSEELLKNAFNYVEEFHHDVGFMFHLTSGVNYRLTGNIDAKNRNLIAAMSLASRYNVDGEFIRAWNGEGQGGWTIIDCMMNIPLLYWASNELKDDRFTKIAKRHADMCMRDHVRSDGSTNHVVVHDTEKPNVVLEVRAGQGYSNNSCWSRGASWGLYGFILSYIHTKEKRYLETAKKIANYFIAQLEKTNWLPLLDFCQPETPVYYDATAGAIASCGLIEIAKMVEDESEQAKYLTSAINILKAMEKSWCNWSLEEDSILQMGSVMYSSGQHVSMVYGDYFFAEAILKLKGIEFLAW